MLDHPDVPADLVDRMLDDPNRWVRNNAIYRTGNIAYLRRAARDEWRTRVSVAWNPNTPVDILEKLLRDENQEVAFGVLTNPATPPRLINAAALSKHEQVRWWALSLATSRKLMRAASTPGSARDQP